MSGWWIQPAKGIVVVDDCPAFGVDCSSIPPNVYIVRMWESKDGVKGEILYNHDDRAPVRERFTDPSPYIPIINKWMLAVLSSPPDPSPPLTVDQAQAVKLVMVDALFNLKRQAPITSGGQTYDASDESVSNMQSKAINELVGTTSNIDTGHQSSIVQLQNSMNASIAAFNVNLANHDAYTDLFNSQVTTFNNGITSFNLSINSFNSGVDGFNSGLGSFAAAANSNASIVNYTMPAQTNGALAASTVTTVVFGDPPSAGSTFNPGSVGSPGLADVNFTAGMPPAPQLVVSMPYSSTRLGQMAGVSAGSVPGGAPTSSTQAALTAIMNRRNTLKGTQTTKTTAINALTSVAAIAAYDITGGW